MTVHNRELTAELTERSDVLARADVAPLDAAPRHEPEFAPYAPEGLLQRAMPFLFAVLIAYLLLIVHVDVVDWDWLVGGTALMAGAIALGAVIGRLPLPGWSTIAVPLLYLASTAMLREGTGGTLSGYGALMYLAPLWVALYDSRAKVLVVTGVMVTLQLGQGLAEGGVDTSTVVRRVLLVAMVIGFMSLAVNKGVADLRRAREKLLDDAATRKRTSDELAALNLALQSSNRELEQFAYVSSHDIQEPLRMIRSFSQLFMQRHGETLNDEGRELLGYVVDGAERAQNLVNDLLQYSRVGRSERPFERVSLDEVLERALDTLAPKIEETGAHVERDGTLPEVMGDAPQLESLFVNLVGNAIKYHHAERSPRVRIAGRRTGSSVQVRVEDNGIGFDDQYAEKIFLMFQRLHGRGDYEGTGIGLALCARIVERHGGTIRASGVPGEGATFSFTMEAVG